MLPTGLFRMSLSAFVCAALFPALAGAQDVSVPSHIALVDGEATFTHEGQAEQAAPNIPLVAGDSLETSSGRLDVLFPDGTTLDLDEHSHLDVLSPTLFRLLEGRMLLTVAGTDDPARAVRYQVDTPVATAGTDGPGEYRIAALNYREGPGTEFAVLRGYGSLSTEQSSVALGAGERSFALNGEAPSLPQSFNSARFDAFDRWTASIREARTGTAASGRYLPSELQIYGSALDRAGTWGYEASYGYVWYPRVAATWRPYYYGRWMPRPRYGWTWIGVDVWSWPTHHYGRWGFNHNVWFWIPGRSWGPAWVAWASAPSYVAWSPLGYNGRPVFALSVGFVQVHTSWIYLPRTRFGRSWHADAYAVAPNRIPRATQFVSHREAPVAVPRPVQRAALAAPTNRGAASRGRAGAEPGSHAGDAPRAAAAPRAIPRASSRAPSATPASPSASAPVVGRSRPPTRSNATAPRALERTRSGRSAETTGASPRFRAAQPPSGARSGVTPRTPAALSALPPRVSRDPRSSPSPAPSDGARLARPRSSPAARPEASAPARRAGSSSAPSRQAPLSSRPPAASGRSSVSGRASAPGRSPAAARPSGSPRSAPAARSGASSSRSSSGSSGSSSGSSGNRSSGSSSGRRAPRGR